MIDFTHFYLTFALPKKEILRDYFFNQMLISRTPLKKRGTAITKLPAEIKWIQTKRGLPLNNQKI